MQDTEKVSRLGLALSGGGFRAAFYHIGVLAKMAELGMLKHVESLSTVSGGSIVGVAYYLLLKELLETTADEDITDEHYVKIVEKLETHFLKAIQNNLRMRTFADPIKNMRMWLPNYSRSDAIGKLYEDYIYNPLLDVGNRRIHMGDLLIKPKGVERDFHPGDEQVGNRMRTNKVPVLMLNATSLNSGHNWIFTAKSMGEVPPRNLNFRDIDKKDRYRRVWYKEITSRDKNFSLGSAVAASAGVPGVFPPMAISNLYKDRRVQLVDGGVFDNQGISGLLDPEHLCTDFIVSDASGQSDATDNPKTGLLSVLLTSSDIMSGRVREEMVNSTEEINKKHMAYFHLTRGLFAKDIEFNNGTLSATPGSKMSQGITPSENEFDVNQKAQRALAHIRTDLDSFTDVEAGCLQLDGYQMSEPRLKEMSEFLSPNPTVGEWGFSRYKDVLRNGDAQMLTQLNFGENIFLKPYIYLFKGALDFKKTLGLLINSIPLIVTFLLIIFAVDWGVKNFLDVDIRNVVTDMGAYKEFFADAALGITFVFLAWLLSAAVEMLIPGSSRLTRLIRMTLKGPMSFVTGVLLHIIIPALIAFPVWLYVCTVDKYYLKVIGKLD